ncbi:MAG: NYN domain-containing protein [Planctomycetes bacterium]|nr:NYN domain-containing protein [Planctomycetota bacterium]
MSNERERYELELIELQKKYNELVNENYRLLRSGGVPQSKSNDANVNEVRMSSNSTSKNSAETSVAPSNGGTEEKVEVLQESLESSFRGEDVERVVTPTSTYPEVPAQDSATEDDRAREFDEDEEYSLDEGAEAPAVNRASDVLETILDELYNIGERLTYLEESVNCLLDARPESNSLKVAVLVDVQNMYYAAKKLYGARLSYQKLLDIVLYGRVLYRAVAYVVNRGGNQSQSHFLDLLTSTGFEVRVKDVSEREGTQSRGSEWTVGMSIDAMNLADKVDVIVLVSGDGDFTETVRAIESLSVRVEVVSFEDTTAKGLIDAASAFYALDKEALYERGSTNEIQLSEEGQQIVKPLADSNFDSYSEERFVDSKFSQRRKNSGSNDGRKDRATFKKVQSNSRPSNGEKSHPKPQNFEQSRSPQPVDAAPAYHPKPRTPHESATYQPFHEHLGDGD